MKKVVFRSLLVVLLLMGIFHGKASAAGTTSQATDIRTVFSIGLPVFKENPNLQSPEQLRELSFNDQVTVLEEVRNAARIRTADGTEGWVYKEYLTTPDLLKNQTWLVKKGRNLRDENGASIGYIPDHSKVAVLDYNVSTHNFKIQTVDHQGWIYGWYLLNEESKMNKGGFDVIPYDFEKEGKVTNAISLFSPLNTMSNITASEINRFIDYKTQDPRSKMKGMGSTYIEAQNLTGLNAIYLLAHSGLESKWGISDIVLNKNNFYGIGAIDSNATDGASSFNSPVDGIINGAKYININYINRDSLMPDAEYPYSQLTLDNMRFNDGNHQYSSDPAWAGKIANIAKEFYEFTFAKDETLKKGWYHEGQTTYYFDQEGKMVTGNQTIDGRNYFFFNNGYLKWGWVQTGGNWFYINQDGSYKTGWLYDQNKKWYYLNSSGVMQTGWKYINGKWYFLNPSGDMKTGWVKTSGKWYFLENSGAMKTGWLYTGGNWYFLNGSGAMQTGWVLVNSKWYYLYSDGHMAANTIIGGYRVGKDGAWIR